MRTLRQERYSTIEAAKKLFNTTAFTDIAVAISHAKRRTDLAYTMEDLVIFLLGFTIGPYPQVPELIIPVIGDTGAGDPDFNGPCCAELEPALRLNFPGFSGVDATDVEKRGVGTCESSR